MAAGGFLLTILLLLVASEGLEATPAEARATKAVALKLQGDDYHKMIRPPGTGPTIVALQLYIRDMSIDDVNMKANFDITFRMLWNDSRLAYKGMPGLAGVNYVSLLDPSPLWLPDAFFKNAKVTQYSSIRPEQYLRVFPDGRIIFSTRWGYCCDIADYGYTTKDVKLVLSGEDESQAVSVGAEVSPEGFTFAGISSDTYTSSTATGEYSNVRISVMIRRYFGNYLLERYIPTLNLIIVAWFSFLIPAKQFLARILLTLIPLIFTMFTNMQFKMTLASVPYATAMDAFSGVSLIVLFLTLLYVIVCEVYENKKNEGEEKASVEDGEVTKGGEAEGGLVRRLALRARQRANYLSRVLLVSGYSFFLFVYFVAFCATG
ncbi:glutamate-gated chloride channel-like [Eriocheir sinensis]|uniref:glutamate-gated chloride channel-like n=1 Tax=Eriocheir sinensis TaxID=95602 RepID=UPI0021C6FB68|nr:glutamate-gated chloride channel-like [Eriocheir sinensis]